MLIRDLNALYQSRPAMYARDCEPEGFRWVVVNDEEQSVLAFLRFGGDGEAPVAIVSNLTPVVRRDYRIGLPTIGRWVEAINTDAVDIGDWAWATSAASPPTGNRCTACPLRRP